MNEKEKLMKEVNEMIQDMPPEIQIKVILILAKILEHVGPITADSIVSTPKSPKFDEIEEVEIKEMDTSHINEKGWHTLLYNDEVHSMDEVIDALSEAGKSRSEAEEIMFTAHKKGVASAHHEPIEKGEEGKHICEMVMEILHKHGLQSETLFVG